MSGNFFKGECATDKEINGVYDGPVLHERLYRKVKQDNMNEQRTLKRTEKLIHKEVRFVKSKISMEKKLLADKSMMSAARVRKLEQEDNLIKGRGRKQTVPNGPPHTQRRAKQKKEMRYAQFSKQKKEEIADQNESDNESNDSRVGLRPPPLLPPLYRQKPLFPQRSWDRPKRTVTVKVDDLYECRYLRLSERQQVERDGK